MYYGNFKFKNKKDIFMAIVVGIVFIVIFYIVGLKFGETGIFIYIVCGILAVFLLEMLGRYKDSKRNWLL